MEDYFAFTYLHWVKRGVVFGDGEESEEDAPEPTQGGQQEEEKKVPDPDVETEEEDAEDDAMPTPYEAFSS